MQKLPIITELNKVEIKKVYGQSIFDYHQQIRKLIASKKGLENIRDFFAEPSVNATKQQIVWYTHLQGEIKSLTNITAIERIEISKIIELIYIEIKKLADELAKSQGASSLGAEALRSMLITPDISLSLFKVDDKLVLLEWGCIPFGSIPEKYDLYIQDKNYKTQLINKIPDPISTATVAANNITEPLIDDKINGSSISNILQQDEKQPVNDPSEPILEIVEPVEQMEEVGDVEPIEQEEELEDLEPINKENKKTIIDWFCILKLLCIVISLILLIYLLSTKPWLEHDVTYRDANEKLKLEIANLWDRVDQKARNCSAETDTQIDKPDENKDAIEMKFPTKKKDLSELKGCWTTPKRLVEQNTKLPLEYHYCFRTNNGSGYVTMDLANGDHCETALKTIRRNNKLTMSYNTIICENSIFSAGRIECHEENGLAVCDLIDIANGVDEPVETQIRGAHFNKVEGE